MFQIERLALYGIMAVYRRKWREWGMRRFFVSRETDGKTLEEFRRRKDAIQWAISHKNG